ncbi:hypothetical protein Taro_047036 [Colocasia esculenta]|uniref:Uncharacterized protein n=1 Tax=Colocasia esculenta TaxID=4460 RepID=A0A843X3A0_COLES|nr:hypothetical protein [Colocasia esculenta]
MGWSLELIHCQLDLILLGALHCLKRTLQLVRPTLSSVWVIVAEEPRWLETQESLQNGSPICLLLWYYCGRYWRLTFCCHLPWLPRPMQHGPEELLGHGEPICILLGWGLVPLLLMPPPEAAPQTPLLTHPSEPSLALAYQTHPTPSSALWSTYAYAEPYPREVEYDEEEEWTDDEDEEDDEDDAELDISSAVHLPDYTDCPGDRVRLPDYDGCPSDRCIEGQNRSLFYPDELGGGLWPLIQDQRHSRWTLSMMLATKDFAVNTGAEPVVGKPPPWFPLASSCSRTPDGALDRRFGAFKNQSLHSSELGSSSSFSLVKRQREGLGSRFSWRGCRYCRGWRSTLSSLLKSRAIFDLVVAAPALQASTRYQPTLGTTICLPAMGTLFLHTRGTYRSPQVAVGEVQDLAVPGPVAPPARHVAARLHGPALRHAYLSKCIEGQNRSLFCPDELGGGLWPLIQGQRHSRWTLSMILATRDFAVNAGAEPVVGKPPLWFPLASSCSRTSDGALDRRFGAFKNQSLHSSELGSSSFFSLVKRQREGLGSTFGSEKSASTSLDARISVGVHEGTPQPDLDPKVWVNAAGGPRKFSMYGFGVSLDTTPVLPSYVSSVTSLGYASSSTATLDSGGDDIRTLISCTLAPWSSNWWLPSEEQAPHIKPLKLWLHVVRVVFLLVRVSRGEMSLGMRIRAHTQAALQAQLEAQERADVWWSSLLHTRFEDGAVEVGWDEFNSSFLSDKKGLTFHLWVTTGNTECGLDVWYAQMWSLTGLASIEGDANLMNLTAGFVDVYCDGSLNGIRVDAKLCDLQNIVGCPRFSVSQAVSSGLFPGTCVVPSRSVSSDLDTLTPVFELYFRLRERRQWDNDCRTCLLVTCSALVVGGTDTSSRHWSPASPFPVPHSSDSGPGSLEVPGMGLRPCGPQVVVFSWSPQLLDLFTWSGS